MDTDKDRLQELSGSDYEIVDEQPDIRGWDIKDMQNRTFGKVDELIFDPQSRKVRYMVVDVKRNKDLDLESRNVLIPIGLAQLNDKEDEVIIPGITPVQLKMLPEYKRGNISRESENEIRNVLSGSNGKYNTGNYYEHEYFNEENLYKNRGATNENTVLPVIKEKLEVGKREVETGGVHVQSRVVEKPVEEEVNLREEHINIERNQTDRPATEADFTKAEEQEIELKEYKEEPVINKQARVVEEVKINKEISERDETIRDKVRNTEVEVKREGEDKKQVADQGKP